MIQCKHKYASHYVELMLSGSDRNIVLVNEHIECLSKSVEKSWSQEIVVEVLTEMKRNAVDNDQFHLQTLQHCTGK